MKNLILSVQCESKRGIVSAIAGFLTKMGCNIIDSAQFDDLSNKSFFMRTSFVPETGETLERLRKDFEPIAEEHGMTFEFFDPANKVKTIIMVSRFGHCLNDIIYRWRIGALPIDIVAVVSNHRDYEKLVLDNDLPFHEIAIKDGDKKAAEDELMKLVENTGAELIVLARYMQVLSDALCKKMSGRIINIHHSFLPSFKGANPYKQAFQRGVKLIGATAHYVTADLDEGPIIEQDTARVTHAQSAADYVAIGRDVECNVLARAIHAHVQNRTCLSGNRVIVFPASPGAFASERMG